MRLGTCLVAICCVGLAGPALASASETPPSFVVIMTDDQGINSLQNMSLLDSVLTQQGLTFNNSFVDFSLCSPSRSSFFTGKSSHNAGIVGNRKSQFGGYSAFKNMESNSLPSWLKNSGYKTAIFGKYMNEYNRVVPKKDLADHSKLWSNYEIVTHSKPYDYFVNSNGKLLTKGSLPKDYMTDYFGGRAVDYIKKNSNADKSLFMYIAPQAAHLPFTPAPRHIGDFADLELPMPPNFNEEDISDKPGFNRLDQMTDEEIATLRSEFIARQETLKSVEELVKDVIDALDETGRLENTYIILTSDNGIETGEHRRPGGKATMYEESIRVPLIIRGPGIPKGEARDQLVNNLDLTATIADLAGIKPGRGLDGRSLGSLFTDPHAGWRTTLYIGGLIGQEADLSLSADKNRFRGVRTESYAYSRNKLSNGNYVDEFYDLSIDPYELENRVDDPEYAKVINQLRHTLKEMAKCSGSNCWIDTPEPEKGLVTASRKGDKKRHADASATNKPWGSTPTKSVRSAGARTKASVKKVTLVSARSPTVRKAHPTGPAAARSTRAPGAKPTNHKQAATSMPAKGHGSPDKATSRDAGKKSADASGARTSSSRSSGGRIARPIDGPGALQAVDSRPVRCPTAQFGGTCPYLSAEDLDQPRPRPFRHDHFPLDGLAVEIGGRLPLVLAASPPMNSRIRLRSDTGSAIRSSKKKRPKFSDAAAFRHRAAFSAIIEWPMADRVRRNRLRVFTDFGDVSFRCRTHIEYCDQTREIGSRAR